MVKVAEANEKTILLMSRPAPYNVDDLLLVQTGDAEPALIQRVLKCMSDARDIEGLSALVTLDNPLVSKTARHYLRTNRLYKVIHGKSKRKSYVFPIETFMPPAVDGIFVKPIPPLDLPRFNDSIRIYLRNHGSMPCHQISMLFFEHNSPYVFIEFLHCYSRQMQRFLCEKLVEELLEFSSGYCCRLEKDESGEQKVARSHYQRILEYYIKLYSSVRLRIYRMKTSFDRPSQSTILQSKAKATHIGTTVGASKGSPHLSLSVSLQDIGVRLATPVTVAPPTPDLRELALESKMDSITPMEDMSIEALDHVSWPEGTLGAPSMNTPTAPDNLLTSALPNSGNIAPGENNNQSAGLSGIDTLGELFQCDYADMDSRYQPTVHPNGRFPHEIVLELIPIGECIRALAKPYSKLRSFLIKCCSIDPLRFFKALKIYNPDGSYNQEIHNFRLHCQLTKQFAAHYTGNLTYPYHLYDVDLDDLISPFFSQTIYENYVNSRRISFTSALIGDVLSNIHIKQIQQTPSRISDFRDKVARARTGRAIYGDNQCLSFIQLIGVHFKQSLNKYGYLLQKPETFIANGYSYTTEIENDRSQFVALLKTKAFKKLVEVLQVFVERAIMVECDWTRSSFDGADAITSSNVLKFVSYNDLVLRYYKHIMGLIEAYNSIASTDTKDVFLSSYIPPPETQRHRLDEAFANESIYHPCIITSIYLLQFLKEQLSLIEDSEDSYTTQLAYSLLSSLESNPMFSYYYPHAQKILIASLSSLLVNLLYIFTASEPGDFRTSIYMDMTNISDTLQRLLRHFSLTSFRSSGSEIVMLGSHVCPTLSNKAPCGGSGELSVSHAVQSLEEYIESNNFTVVTEDQLLSSLSPDLDEADSASHKLRQLLKTHNKVYLVKPRSVVYNEAYEILMTIIKDPEALYVFLILMDGVLYAREISPLLLSDNIYLTLLSAAIRFKNRFHQLDLVIERLNEISHYWFANRKMLKGLILHETPHGLMITGPSADFPAPTPLIDINAHYARLVAHLNDELLTKSNSNVIHSAASHFAHYAGGAICDSITDVTVLCTAGDLISPYVRPNHLIKSKFSLNERTLISLPSPIKITFTYINMLSALDMEEISMRSEKLSKTTPIIEKLLPFSQSSYMAPLVKFTPYHKGTTVLFKKEDGFDWNEKLPSDLAFESLVIRAVGGFSRKSYQVDVKSRARIEKLATAAFKTRFEPFILVLLHIIKTNIQHSLSIKLVTLAIHLSFYFKNVLAICSLGRFLLPMKLKPYNKDFTTVELKVLAHNASVIIYNTIHVHLRKYQMVIDRFLSHALGDNLYSQVDRYVLEDLTSIEVHHPKHDAREGNAYTEHHLESFDDTSLSAPASVVHSRRSSVLGVGGIDSGLKTFFERKRLVITSSKVSSRVSSPLLCSSEVSSTHSNSIKTIKDPSLLAYTPLELPKLLKPTTETLNIYFYKSRIFMKDIIDMCERKYFDQYETMEAVMCILKYFVHKHVEAFSGVDKERPSSGVLRRLRLYEYFKRLEITDLICEQIYTAYCFGIPALCVS
ncbi:Hypothetical protein DHA2_7350 [Giardia duodenalis]|uniref:Uncharacterized protein n=1 Tax=Giardia intestinalis TaxID=5741 RepID=V6T980_GIAIN|nr:Hypothetical protein DHA2_7350 [Giardia intestinalis]